MVVWDFKGKEGSSQEDNVCWAMKKQPDNERNFNKEMLLNSLLSTTPSSCYTVVISDDSTLPGAGPLSKFFEAVRRQAKVSS